MTSQEIKALTGQYIMNTYGRFPVAIDHGQGATLYDPEGNAYIDFTSGIGVSDLGYGCQPWVDAIAKQAGKIGHTSNLFYTEPPARLAEILCKRTGMSSVFFANGGGEANEGMIKLARKYSFDKYGRGRAAIVTLNNSFHGRTITTLTATGQDVFHNYFFPFTEGFRYADANDLASLEAAAGDDVCAVMMELVQGEGGVLPLDRDYVKAVARLCAEKDCLLLVDEVQTGVGRTGSLFAFQQYGILPDVASFAKGIAGGLPMSGILANEKCRDVLGPGTHATTFGANPVCAAAGLVVQETLTDAFLEDVRAKGTYLRNQIEALDLPCFGATRGMGLMIGIQVKDGWTNKEIASKLIENGVLQQYDAPLDVYAKPNNVFVADFVGNPAINFIDASGAQQSDGTLTLSALDGMQLSFRPKEPLDVAAWYERADAEDKARRDAENARALDKKSVEKGNKDVLFRYHVARVNETEDFGDEAALTDGDFVLGVRPEFLRLSDSGAIEGEIYSAMPTGMETTVKVRVGSFLLTGVVFGGVLYRIGQKIRLDFQGDGVVLFSRRNGRMIAQGSLSVK